MTIPFESRLVVPTDVVVRELDGESVILNLTTEAYYGLDAVGTRMWSLVTSRESVQDAYDALLTEYDVTPEVLREDLQKLLADLVEHGLLAPFDAQAPARS